MRRFLILLTALACLLLGCGAEPEAPTLPPPEASPWSAADFTYENGRMAYTAGTAVTGIDVSSYQRAIDWEAVAADGVAFAMIRVGYRGFTEGRIQEDDAARANIEGALAAGLDVGVYFFSQAISTQEAAREAAFVISFVEGYDISMPVVFDWEHVSSDSARTAQIHDKALLTDCALTFLEAVEAAGYESMVYFNASQSRDLLDLRVLRDHGFWLAMYETEMNYPYAVSMWQYTDRGTVAGIEGNVDLNLYFPE